jgi:hypothetical protein
MKEWDTVKFILFASLFLCLTGVGLYFYQVNDLKKMKTDVPYCMSRLTDIGQLSAEVDMLKTEYNNDKMLSGNLKVREYVSKQANESGIPWRVMSLEPESEIRQPRDGYVDLPRKLTAGRNQKFRRSDIAEFIFKLQTRTSRLKVTELLLDKPGPKCEVWFPTMTITERSPLQEEQ